MPRVLAVSTFGILILIFDSVGLGQAFVFSVASVANTQPGFATKLRITND